MLLNVFEVGGEEGHLGVRGVLSVDHLLLKQGFEIFDEYIRARIANVTITEMGGMVFAGTSVGKKVCLTLVTLGFVGCSL
jgi:hypothetical protein